MYKKMLCLMGCFLLLTGCWDKIELNERAYAVTIGVDAYDAGRDEDVFTFDGKNSRFLITLAMPHVDNGDATEEVRQVKKGAGKTLAQSVSAIDASNSKNVYFGHAQIVILGESILSDDELLKETLDALERDNDISMKLIVLACEGDAFDIVAAEIEGVSLIGAYVSEFYMNSKMNLAQTFRLDLENFLKSIRDGGEAIIPKISIENDAIIMAGAALIKDYTLSGWLSSSETRGLLWVSQEVSGAIVNTQYKEHYVPMKVIRHKTDIDFYEVEGQLFCKLDIKVTGNIESFTFDGPYLSDEGLIRDLERQYADEIQKEIESVNELLQMQYTIDGHELLNHMKKFHYPLWVRYKEQWETGYGELNIAARVEVELRSIGMIK